MTRELGKLTGKIKSFSFGTRRVCKQCGRITKHESSRRYRCPNCGFLGWRKLEIIWYGVSSVDVFEMDVKVIFLERTIAQLLDKLDMSWQMLMDKLKGLRGTAWFEVFKHIKREIEQAVEDQFINKLVTVHGTMENSIFVAKKLESKSSLSEMGTRFIKGKQREILKLARKLLREYELEVELWDGTPILRFSKNLDGEDVEIGIRAPIAEYGKSYRVWMRVNGVHMYSAKPVRLKTTEAWVLRAYHTKNWKRNLAYLIEHCMGLVNQAVKIVQAARKLSVKKAQELLSPELSYEEKKEILRRWSNGSLWDLAEEANRINRRAALFVLKKFGILKYREI